MTTEISANQYSEIPAKKVDWLWYPYIAYGKITLLEGDPGDGKSTFILQLAALLTTGKKLPDGTKGKRPINVIYQCTEDDPSDTIKPRLLKAGANCERVLYFPNEPDLALDDNRLPAAITKLNAKLVIFDPIQSFIPKDADMLNAIKMRSVMATLAKTAEDPETDKLVINPEEAKVVRLCFGLYLSGFSFTSIADTLTGLGVKTYTGKDTWNPGTIQGILSNERHYGAVLAHKTYTPSFLNHKAKKNDGQRRKYFREADHEPIVSKTIFEAAAKKMEIAHAYKQNSPMPSLSVVDEGILTGYVPVNRKWQGFTDEDFLAATESVYEPAEQENGHDAFTLDDYQVVSASLFTDMQQPKMTIRDSKVKFNTACLKKFENVEYVEILLNSVEKCIAIRPSSKENPNAIRWGRLKDSKWLCSEHSALGLINPVVALMGWDRENKYVIRGQFLQQDDGKLLIFDLSDVDCQTTEPEEEDTGESDFGEPAVFGDTIYVEHRKYSGNWDVLRPAAFYKYCSDITEDEMKKVRATTEELLEELREA